ncbi:MAG: nucleotidyltransferase domain-containing protein [Anaerolineales bacterium]|nr:nucleotidyltransferase domain-containing protein [Anaerolineales bacterium]
MLKWPEARAVAQAVREWAETLGRARPDVLRIGYFGSYARKDWGVGSDLDVLIIVERSDAPFHRRGVEWDATGLPVPADVLVYTQAEWEALMQAGSRFSRALSDETRWVYVRPPD